VERCDIVDVKLVIFDMDGTLLRDHFIEKIAKTKGFWEELKNLIDSEAEEGYKMSEKIAAYLKGMDIQEVISVADKLEFNTGVEETANFLRINGINFGIISDSYKQVAQVVGEKLEVDFIFANELLTDNNGIITGEIEMPLGWEKIGCFCKNSVCKRFYSQKMLEIYGISFNEALVVGDNLSDLCMLEYFPRSLAFNPKNEKIKEASAYVIENDMRNLLEYL
jgi:phosphoserine phosphatase